ncbi:hypothetical protein HNQ59_001290 [Chitinivorax tropicus]|uniref:Uncharacterized protein n=1 Tax=Chitinivorax tropicus TaxID=714531 RepID=A0A840MKH4_9PROT|nr:hypothetical protein [Chitinivorax tropicus]MBB5018005.1 hypothetical protein [Chitinivorax tropicus]
MQTYTQLFKFTAMAASMLAGSLFISQGARADGTCPANVKEEVVKIMINNGAEKMPDEKRLSLEADLYKKFAPCSKPDTKLLLPEGASCGKTSYRGSLWYEEMSCCGYDPQRRMFACPVSVKQSYGFGGSPLPGSREYVLNCVWSGGGFLPVAMDSVHLANASGQNPPWQFAVIAAANTNINLVQPMSGASRSARSILSWQLQPTDCNYKPIWGNVVDYMIRLDQ